MNRIIHDVRYSTWLIGQVIVGAFVIVFDVIRVRSQMHPAVVEYPLRVRSDWELAAFSTSITMTPGTLSLGFKDVDESGCPRVLLVHAVYGADPDEVIAGLADMEERLAPHVKEVA